MRYAIVDSSGRIVIADGEQLIYGSLIEATEVLEFMQGDSMLADESAGYEIRAL